MKPNIYSENKTYRTKYGEEYTIVAYTNCKEVTIKYADGTICKCSTINIRKGNPPNPNRNSTLDRGFIGDGINKISSNGNKTDSYIKWQGMLHRVFGEQHASNLCYDGCTVRDDWLNFQNFADWYKQKSKILINYQGEICLEKDLLVPGNTLYSRDTCCLVPYEINVAMVLVRGFSFNKTRGLYSVNVTRKNSHYKPNSVFVGRYSSIDECALYYAKRKNEYIAYLAAKYSKYLDTTVLSRLMNFDTMHRLKLKGVI